MWRVRGEGERGDIGLAQEASGMGRLVISATPCRVSDTILPSSDLRSLPASGEGGFGPRVDLGPSPES